MLAILVYLAAAAIPIWLLYRFHSQAWYWHLLAIAIAAALGFVPIPPDYQKRGFDLVAGFALVALFCWGIGGLAMPHQHHEKHA